MLHKDLFNVFCSDFKPPVRWPGSCPGTTAESSVFHGDAAGPGHLSEKIPLEEEKIYILFLRADHPYRNKVLCCIFSTCLGWTKGGEVTKGTPIRVRR